MLAVRLGLPTVICAGLFAWVADQPIAAGLAGALFGLVLGIALMAYPDLDRGGPSDSSGIFD